MVATPGRYVDWFAQLNANGEQRWSERKKGRCMRALTARVKERPLQIVPTNEGDTLVVSLKKKNTEAPNYLQHTIYLGYVVDPV